MFTPSKTRLHAHSILLRLYQPAVEYDLTAWLFLKLLALIYFAAFLSLAVQITGLVGTNGILPFGTFLDAAYRQQGWHAWLQIPTLFWLGSGDTALRSATASGCLLSILLLCGVWIRASLVGLFVLYLSLYHAGQIFLGFQWDSLLLETGFLAIFLARGPTGLLLFLFHWLLFRLRFMSGLSKLASGDPSWIGLKALDYYFETQPLPHFGAWFAHQLPGFILKAGVLFTLFAELVVPFLIFLPRRYRIFAAAVTVLMQGLIIATSNHNFVNLLTLLLCLFLLDDPIVAKMLPGRFRNKRVSEQSPPGKSALYFLSGFAVIVLVCSMTRYVFYWLVPHAPYPAVLRQTSMLAEAYGQANMYHIFAIIQTERQELEIQGSSDGRSWFPYLFRYKPGPLGRRPPFIVPHQPRLDWMIWFVPPRRPSNLVWFYRFLDRLREGSPQVLALLKHNPFPDRPPRFLRVLVYRYHFTTWEEREKTGHWWKREYLGLFPDVPPRRP